MSYEDPPESRGPRRGRPASHGEPVTVVSISMDPATLRDIDEFALRNQRSRSAFVRWVLMSYIRMKRDAESEKPATFNEPDEFDATHGGRFDPAMMDRPMWGCINGECDMAPTATGHLGIVGGWNECPMCATPRPPDTA